MFFGRRLILALIALLAAVQPFCAQVPFAEVPRVKADVREAIFRYMLDRYNYGGSIKVLCIQADTLLPDRFLSRFAKYNPPVVWAADCETGGLWSNVRLKKTGEPGELMTISLVRWISGEEAEAKVEAFCDGIAANWNTLRVVRSEGQWKVKGDKLDSVS